MAINGARKKSITPPPTPPPFSVAAKRTTGPSTARGKLAKMLLEDSATTRLGQILDSSTATTRNIRETIETTILGSPATEDIALYALERTPVEINHEALAAINSFLADKGHYEVQSISEFNQLPIDGATDVLQFINSHCLGQIKIGLEFTKSEKITPELFIKYVTVPTKQLFLVLLALNTLLAQ